LQWTTDRLVETALIKLANNRAMVVLIEPSLSYICRHRTMAGLLGRLAMCFTGFS